MEADRLFRPPTEVADARWHGRRKQHDRLSRGERRVLLQERSGNRVRSRSRGAIRRSSFRFRASAPMRGWRRPSRCHPPASAGSRTPSIPHAPPLPSSARSRTAGTSGPDGRQGRRHSGLDTHVLHVSLWVVLELVLRPQPSRRRARTRATAVPRPIRCIHVGPLQMVGAGFVRRGSICPCRRPIINLREDSRSDTFATQSGPSPSASWARASPSSSGLRCMRA